VNDLTPLFRLVDLAERRCTVYRPPNFRVIPDEATIVRRRLRRRATVTSYGIGLGLGVMLGVTVAQIIIALWG
jgi:hypothetical protein